ncbi:hypothetical protein EGP99_00675 [bacterium]|nr:hypothetical protein [bacterium]
MKVFKNGKVYVQNEDLILILRSGELMPTSVLEKFYGNGPVIIVQDNMEDYVEFEETDQVEFFKRLNWIVDYDEVKNLSTEELEKLYDDTKDEMVKIRNKYSDLSQNDDCYEKDSIRYELLGNKLYSLSKIQYFKARKLELALPNETGICRLIRKFKNKIKEK